MEITKPFLKWVGGKTQILHLLLGQFPKQMYNYHEPFVGGGSVLLGLLSWMRSGDIVVDGTIYASDANEHLIALYKNIQCQSKVLLLIEELEGLLALAALARTTGNGTVNRACATQDEAIASSPESFYYWVRQEFNHMAMQDKTSVATSARLLFLNKTCFRGIYREGPHGFNVPFGHYKNPTVVCEPHVRAVSTLLQGVVFRCVGFEDAVGSTRTGDFVYLDPPYAPENSTSFVSYTADGFSLEDHKILFSICDKIEARMLMSNSDVALVNEAFAGTQYTKKTISCRRSINSKSPESRTNEVLITNITA